MGRTVCVLPERSSPPPDNAPEELERLRKQVKQEQLLKMQAVNKLAEIMNRKDINFGGRGKSAPKSSAELRKKEKECRRLQQELTQVGGSRRAPSGSTGSAARSDTASGTQLRFQALWIAPCSQLLSAVDFTFIMVD